MFKKISFIGLLLFSLTIKAHQADASTTMLVEQENGTWVLQISSSLTAFQQEIRTHFSKTPYTTPEEFQQMVLEHINNKFLIEINDGQKITLSRGEVRLGHETKVIFEVLGMPEDLESILVQNKAFEEINRSQSSLLLLKEGFNKDRFVLNKANNYTLELQVDGNKFVEIVEHEANLFSSGLILVFILVVAALLLAYSKRSDTEIS